MARIFLYSVLLCLLQGTALAQGSAGSVASVETRSIVDMPTAGVVAKGQYAVGLFAFASNGLMAEFSAGIFTNFNAGISFGGTGVIGSNTPVWQKLPGVHVRFRPFDETRSFPAILIGVNTQGRGAYSEAAQEFQVQSPGVFLAISKSFRWLGTLAWHGGINYSFEPPADDRQINGYLGFEKSIGAALSVAVEYNAALQGRSSPLVEEGGLLNAGVRCSLGRGFTLELQFQDMLRHYRNTDDITRTLSVEYIGGF